MNEKDEWRVSKLMAHFEVDDPADLEAIIGQMDTEARRGLAASLVPSTARLPIPVQVGWLRFIDNEYGVAAVVEEKEKKSKWRWFG